MVAFAPLRPPLKYYERLEHVLEYRGSFQHGYGLTDGEAVRLPEELAVREYLGEYYGTVEWSVKSIYQGYVGWFDGDPVKLMPVPEAEYRRAQRAYFRRASAGSVRRSRKLAAALTPRMVRNAAPILAANCGRPMDSGKPER